PVQSGWNISRQGHRFAFDEQTAGNFRKRPIGIQTPEKPVVISLRPAAFARGSGVIDLPNMRAYGTFISGMRSEGVCGDLILGIESDDGHVALLKTNKDTRDVSLAGEQSAGLHFGRIPFGKIAAIPQQG